HYAVRGELKDRNTQHGRVPWTARRSRASRRRDRGTASTIEMTDSGIAGAATHAMHSDFFFGHSALFSRRRDVCCPSLARAVISAVRLRESLTGETPSHP